MHNRRARVNRLVPGSPEMLLELKQREREKTVEKRRRQRSRKLFESMPSCYLLLSFLSFSPGLISYFLLSDHSLDFLLIKFSIFPPSKKIGLIHICTYTLPFSLFSAVNCLLPVHTRQHTYLKQRNSCYYYYQRYLVVL